MRTKLGVYVLMALACLAGFAPAARADMIFTSSAGFCCFSVDLHQAVNPGDVLVTVTLIDGATLFANTGNGADHPGFAFNLAGAAITGANIQNAQNLGAFHVGPDATNGPDFGTFDYYFDIPGHGTSAGDAGPLSFDVVRPGLLIADFIPNDSGYSFAADIQNGTTGEAGVNSPGVDPPDSPNFEIAPVPEPASLVLFGTTLALASVFLRKRLQA